MKADQDVTQAQSCGALAFSTEALRRKARTLAADGDDLEAARVYQVAFDVDPDDLEVGLRLALHWERAGQSMRAARVLLQVARIFGSLGHARRATALAQRALAIDARAARLSALQPVAVAVGRPIVPVICAAAELRAKDGRLEEARALLRLAVDADGLRVAAVRRLAELEQHMGDEAAARDVLDRLARGLLRFGRMHEFATVAEHYLTLSPHDPFILQALAHAHLRAGRARAALPRLQLLARLDPSDAGTLLELAEVHAGLRHRKAGLVALARWAWLRSRDGGTLDQVRAQLERAAKWWPTDEGWRDGVFALAVRGPRQTKISIGDVDLVLQSAEPPPPPPARLSA